MRLKSLRPAGLAVGLILAPFLLAGCTTPVKVQPSAAVLDMRAAAAERTRQAALAGCVDPRQGGAEATIVRFGFLDDSLDDMAARHLAPVLAYARCARTGIVAAGEADQHGTAEQQQALIARRIAVVVKYLVAGGVDAARISSVASATDAPAGDGAPLFLLARGRGW